MAKQAAATMVDLSLPGMPRAELLGSAVHSDYVGPPTQRDFRKRSSGQAATAPEHLSGHQ